MIHEYALEPELVASWHDRMKFRFFIDQFGFGEARVVSLYPKSPKRWNELVWEAFNRDFREAASTVDVTRMKNLLKKIMKPVAKRPGRIWDATHDWLTNAENEHTRKPFDVILARNNPSNNAGVMRESEVLEDTAKGWDAPGMMDVPRNAEEMASLVAPMLRCATKILFVDPNFRANRERFRKPLAAFLQSVDTQTAGSTIELHTEDRDDTPSWEEFRKECKKELPSIIPEGLTLSVYRWKERDDGEKLHNRHILTDVGGVAFLIGLDEGDPGNNENEEVARHSANTYAKEWESYAGSNGTFDLDGEIFAIEGRATG